MATTLNITKIVGSNAVQSAFEKAEARIQARIDEHINDEQFDEYVAGLRDALALMLVPGTKEPRWSMSRRDEVQRNEPPMRKSDSGGVDHP